MRWALVQAGGVKYGPTGWNGAEFAKRLKDLGANVSLPKLAPAAALVAGEWAILPVVEPPVVDPGLVVVAETYGVNGSVVEGQRAVRPKSQAELDAESAAAAAVAAEAAKLPAAVERYRGLLGLLGLPVTADSGEVFGALLSGKTQGRKYTLDGVDLDHYELGLLLLATLHDIEVNGGSWKALE